MKWIRIFESHRTFPCNYVDSIDSITNVHIWKSYRQINQTFYWGKVLLLVLGVDHTHLALALGSLEIAFALSSWAAKLNIQYLFSRWDRGMCLMLVQSVRFFSFLLWTTKANCMYTRFFRWNFRSLFLRQLFAFFSCSPYLCENHFSLLDFSIFLSMQWMCVEAQMCICAWLDEIQLNF